MQEPARPDALPAELISFRHMKATFGHFEMDAERRQITADGSLVHLTPKAFDLLWLLVEAAPRVVAKSEIHARLWPGGAVSDATLVGMVKEIRRALSDSSAEIPVVRTAHRIGYALDLPVHRAAAETDHSHWLIAGTMRVALVAGENVIGRDPAARMWLDHPTISRRHARVTLLATQTVLEDLGSRNGTIFRGAALRGVVTLRSGDEFICGQLPVSYQLSNAALPTVAGSLADLLRRR